MPENETLCPDCRTANRWHPLRDRVPEFFRRYLYCTHAVERDDELKPHVEVYRRYQIEWADLIADARRRGLKWVTPAGSLSFSQGAAS